VAEHEGDVIAAATDRTLDSATRNLGPSEAIRATINSAIDERRPLMRQSKGWFSKRRVNNPRPSDPRRTRREPPSDREYVAAARARVAADRLRGMKTEEWIVELAKASF
jgi:hypothetical protein